LVDAVMLTYISSSAGLRPPAARGCIVCIRNH
jgi:hypothetical protein